MGIDAKLVKSLREKTGAGMMDCKKALVEAGGDFDKAIDILRKKGQKVSEARSGRETSEGIVLFKIDQSEDKASMLSFTCETDFVAKNEEFVDLGNSILEYSFNNNLDNVEEVLAATIDGLSVSQHITNLIGKIGEKIEISNFSAVKGEKIVPYIHAGSKLGVLVSLTGTDGVDYQSAGKDIGMQIAAMNPISLNSDGVDKSIIDKEIEIGKEQAIKEGKPENIIEKIAQGKLQKFFKENTLLSQSFVKDGSMTVDKYLSSCSPDLKVESFVRISIG